MIDNYLFWFTFGVILIALEMIIPGIFILWFGIGALLTGLLVLLFGGLSAKFIIGIFAVLSFISVLIGRNLMKKRQSIKTGINDTDSKFIGKIVKAYGKFENGIGKVYVGDTIWQAECEQLVNDGDTLKVTVVKNTILKVAAVNKTEEMK